MVFSHVFLTLYWGRCITNDIYQSIKGVGPRHADSFASLIHSLFPPNKSKLGARLSLFCFALLRRVCSHLISSRDPHRQRFRVKPPIPVVARSTPFALLLRSIVKSRLSLDAGVSPSIDLYHIVTMHMKPTNPLCSAKL